MTYQPQTHQFPDSHKPKPIKWALKYNGQEQIQGEYALCIWKKKQLLQGGGLSKSLFKIDPIEYEK